MSKPIDIKSLSLVTHIVAKFVANEMSLTGTEKSVAEIEREIWNIPLSSWAKFRPRKEVVLEIEVPEERKHDLQKLSMHAITVFGFLIDWEQLEGNTIRVTCNKGVS